jgi:hypothetical protein
MAKILSALFGSAQRLLFFNRNKKVTKFVPVQGAVVTGSFLLLESGDYLLLESGDRLILE